MKNNRLIRVKPEDFEYIELRKKELEKQLGFEIKKSQIVSELVKDAKRKGRGSQKDFYDEFKI